MTTDRRKRPALESRNVENVYDFTSLRIYEFTTSPSGEVITRSQIIIYPRRGRMARKIGMVIPLSRLVSCVLTWGRPGDKSRMTTDRRNGRFVNVGSAKPFFTILRVCEITIFPSGGIIPRRKIAISTFRADVKKGLVAYSAVASCCVQPYVSATRRYVANDHRSMKKTDP